MTNEKPSDKPTPQQVESRQFNMHEIETEFDVALKRAMAEVHAGRARVRYVCRDNIQDAEHLKHITVTKLDGTIIYDQDFEIETAILAQPDVDEGASKMEEEHKRATKN